MFEWDWLGIYWGRSGDRGLVDNHQPAPGSTFGISGSSHETYNLCTPLDSMFGVSDSDQKTRSMRTHGSYITCISPNRRCHNVLPAKPVNSQTSGARDAI